MNYFWLQPATQSPSQPTTQSLSQPATQSPSHLANQPPRHRATEPVKGAGGRGRQPLGSAAAVKQPTPACRNPPKGFEVFLKS